jgi:DME family drug/metabolite transporter
MGTFEFEVKACGQRQISWARLRPLPGTVLMAGVAMAGYVLLWFLGIEQMGVAVPTLIALCLPPVIVTALAIAQRMGLRLPQPQ